MTALGILMLDGKMSTEPGMMGSDETWSYPVRREIVAGATTPFTPDAAEALAPRYVEAARRLDAEGVDVITANCGLMALVQPMVAAAVDVPVVLSSLVAVPTVRRFLAPDAAVGILTFFDHAVGERNFRACGWSGDEIKVAIAGVGHHESWLEFLATKKISASLRIRLRADLLQTVHDLLRKQPEIGAVVAECTMLPAVLDDLRGELPVPAFDLRSVLDWVMTASAPRSTKVAMP